ncbi:TonB-dependent receptor domain-containing protein [Tsuneonella sp. HG249]
MSTANLRHSCAFFALAAGTFAAPAWAQVGQPDDATAEAEDAAPERQIVVTGSLIRGSSESAPVPIDVISSDELAKQGSPSVLDLVKNLPTSNGVIGDANQFDARAQGSEGIASVNLRGLGPQRTLVLFNGKRMALTGGSIVDVNMIPGAAIGRIEVLKDGAAATYGSDAIGGVVNFITKENQDGFLASGDYRYIPGSKGDYGGALSFGKEVEGFRFFVSGGYQRRSELRTTDREFTVQPYANNPNGGYTGGGNPGNFDFNGLAAFTDPVSGRAFGAVNFIRDLGCESLGGFRSVAGSFTPGAAGNTPTDRCFTNYGQFDNLVEPEERFQFFMDTEIDLSDSLVFRVNGLWGHSETRITTSPSYLPTLPPSTNAAGPSLFALPGFFVIPTYAPALRDYCRVYGAATAGCSVDATGAPTQPAVGFPVLFRPALLGGNPSFFDDNDRGSAFSPRTSDQVFLSGELQFELSPTLDLTSSLTYSQYDRTISGTDTLGDLLQNALAGFGGPNCAFATPQSRAGLTAAQLAAAAGTNGCTFFNPFSTAVAVNAVTGQTNPNYAGSRPTNGLSTTPGAGLINDVATIDTFFRDDIESRTITNLWVADLVLSGQSGLTLPGGELGFAIGGQYRKNSYSIAYSPVNNLAIFPCPGSPLNPAATCSPQTGALGFLGTNLDRGVKGDVWAAFTELQLPITDALQAQLSARFEDYGGNVGSTFDYQARAKFQLTDWLALRGGVGTTFRGPPPQTLFGNVTSLQVIGTSFRAVDITGNPNLTPESATTYSGGVILDTGPFRASVDYFRYDFSGPIETEPVSGIVTALFGASGAANCNNPAFAALQARFTFTAAGCGIGNVTRLRTNIVNGAKVSTSGIDFTASYRTGFGEDFNLEAGLNGTYVIEYQVEDVSVEGVLVQPAFDAVGKLNFQTTAYPLPQWKGFAYLQGETGPHSLRLQYNYIDGYTDQRTTIFAGAANTGSLAGAEVPGGKEIGTFDTFDATYRLNLESIGSTLSISALNIFDKDPPFARLDFNYDPFTASPLGFTLKVAISQRF